MRPTAAQMAASLGLQPHPEGGYYAETYRAADTLHTLRGERAAATAILFLVTADSVSRLHRLASDELWVFQGGVVLELVTIAPGGEPASRLLGDPSERVASGGAGGPPGPVSPPDAIGLASPPDAAAADASGVSGGGSGFITPLPQALVPAGRWQGARLAGGPHLPADRAWALVSCVCTPGFDFADFELGERDVLLAELPEHGELIRALT